MVIKSIEPSNYNRQKTAYLRVCFIHILLLYILKDNSFFTDLDAYSIYFRSLKTGFNDLGHERIDDRFEIGWYVLNKVVKALGGHILFVFLISYFFILGSFLKFINKYSNSVWISVVLYMCSCFYDSLFVLRQWVAIAICLWSIPYILNRSFMKFMLYALLAFSFHYSALIWIFSYFLYNVGNKKRNFIVLVVFFVFGFFLLNIIIDYLMTIFPALQAYTLGEKLDPLGLKTKPMYINLLTLAFCYYCLGGIENMNKSERLFFLMVICCLFMNVITAFDNSFVLFSRLNLYYGVAAVVLLPNAIVKINDVAIRFLVAMIILFCYILLLNGNAQYGYQLCI